MYGRLHIWTRRYCSTLFCQIERAFAEKATWQMDQDKETCIVDDALSKLFVDQ